MNNFKATDYTLNPNALSTPPHIFAVKGVLDELNYHVYAAQQTLD